MTDKGQVITKTEKGIGTVSFYHPQSNSLPGELLRELAASITSAGNDPGIKVIILKSEGEKTFCAGASFDELASIENMEKGKYFFSGFADVINAMRKAPKFILCRVQGKVVGGGVGLACAADYCFALNTASVKLSELAVGIGPFVVGPAVERKTGSAAFSALAINATSWQTAAWACEKGMFAAIYEDIAALDHATSELAAKLAASNPDAMKQLKTIFWKGTEHWDTLLTERAEMSGQLVLSDFTRQAIAKFKTGAR
jgi:methylglutaconyl-CoA hydratase